MASTIINYFVNTKLSQFLEINPEETQTSLWNGTVELNNIKFKKSVFETLNLPYIELVDGYIGKMKVTLQLPRFYLYPIKIELDKIFLHAKQKSLNDLSKKEQIDLMEKNKKEKLKNDEELTIQMNLLKQESPDYMEQIINNLQIICENVFILFDDEISYFKPFNLGFSFKKVSYFSTKDDFNDENIDTNIEKADIKYKRIRMNEFSIFLDYYSSKNELNYENKILENESNKIDDNLKNYLKDSLNLYLYCMSELNVYGKDRNSHFYILYNLCLDVKLTINDKYKENLLPKFDFDILFPNIVINLEMTQIKALMGIKYNFDAKNYYERGLEKEYYTKKFNEKEISQYIETYLNFYKVKYIEKYIDEEQMEKYEKTLNELEEKVGLEHLMSMRELSKKKIKYLNTINEIDQKIENAKNAWDFLLSKDEEIKQLQMEKEQIKEEEKKLTEEGFLQQILNIKKNFSETDKDSKDLMIYFFKFTIEKSDISILEQLNKPLIQFETNNLNVEVKIRLRSEYVRLLIGGISVSQFCVPNINFNKILYSESSNDKNILSIIFERNSSSDIKLEIKNEKRIYIVINMFYINYISTLFSKSFESFDINNFALYASDEVLKYINDGYLNIIVPGKFQHFNFDFNINLKCPLIIFPVNCHDKNNNNIIFFSFGDIILKSILPPRKDPNKDIINENDEKLIFDSYIIELSNLSAGTKNNFVNFSDLKDDNIVSKTHFSIKIDVKNDSNNKNFENFKIFIYLESIDIKINEEEIVLFVNLFENITRERRLITLIQKELIEKINENKEIIKQIIKEEENEEEEIKEIIKINEEKKENINNEETSNSIKIGIKFGIINISFLKSLTPDEDEIIHRFNNNNENMRFKNFLNLSLYEFETNVGIKYNNLIETKINLGGMYLNDYDFQIQEDGNRKNYFNPEFNCIFGTITPQSINQNKFKLSELIKSSKEQKNNHFIQISFISEPNEHLSKIKIEVNEFFICPNLSSLSRIYQYLKYYFNLYNETQSALKGEELKEKLSKLEYKPYELKGFFKDLKEKKILRRALTEKEKTIKSKPKKTITKIENIERKNEVSIEIKHIDIIFPVDPNNDNTKIFILKFHNNIMLTVEKKYENIYQNYEIIKINYSINNLDLSFSITQGRMDLYSFNNNYIEESQFKDYKFDSLFSDYSILLKIKSSLEHSEKIVNSKIDIITTPFHFIINSLYIYSFFKSFLLTIKYLDQFSSEYCSVTTKTIIRKILTEETLISKELNNDNSEKQIKSNLDKYSFCQEINGNIDNIDFDICDFFNGQYKSLINLNLSNINFVYFSNKDPKDTKNFTNSLTEMISGQKFPIEEYDPKSLFKYIKMTLTIKMDYFNSNLNQWECFMEPYDLNLNLIQVIKRMRQRIELNGDKMLNINISCNILKTLKNLIDKYTKINNIKDDNEKNVFILKKFSGIQHGNKVLKIINETGIVIKVIFNNNENSNEIEIIDQKSFNSQELLQYNVLYVNNNSFNSTISFKLENNKPINFFNFSYNQIKNYLIDYSNCKLNISVSSYIDEELCKCIKFSSSLVIYNHTQFDEIKIINSNNECINIKSELCSSIPLKWFILEDKKLYIQYQEEKLILCENLNNIKEIPQNISFKNNISIAINSQILKEKYVNENSTELINIILSPTFYIDNKSPYEITIKDTIIKSTLKMPLYNIIPKKENLNDILKNSDLHLKYENLDLKCKNVTIDNGIYSILFSNENKEIIGRMEIDEIIPTHNFNSKFLTLINSKFNSICLVFYFDYILINRTNQTISINSEKNSFIGQKDNEIGKVDSKQLLLINKLKINNNYIQIKIDESEWSEKLVLDALGLDYFVKLKNNNNNKYFPIGVLVKPSYIYPKSTLIIFENRYNFINNVGIDLLVKEEFGNEELLKNGEEKFIFLNNEKNLVFKIGIGNEFSQNFNIEESGLLDLSIKINPDEILDTNLKKQLFSLNGTDYYLPIRCIIKTYNKGIIYVMFNQIENPLREIKNNTEEQIEILYNNNKIIIPPKKYIPFIVENSLNIDNIIISLNGKNYNFSFNDIQTKIIKTIEGDYKIQSTPNNSNLTKTILVEFFNKNEKFVYLKERIIQCFSSYSGYKLYLNLKGLGISVINQDPKEILYISLYGITLEKKNIKVTHINQNSEILDNTVLICKNLQIDYCLDNSYKVILSPIQQILPSNEKQLIESNSNEIPTPCIQLCIYQQSKSTLNSKFSVIYPSIELIIQPLNIKIDHFILNQIISLIIDLKDAFGYEEEQNIIILEDENIKTEFITPKDLILKENLIVNSHAINFFNISSIYITITFRLDKNSIHFSSITLLNHILSTLTASLTSISDITLRLNEIIISNAYANFSLIFPLIIHHYIRSIIYQLYKIILGLDILGNPINLLSSIGTGVFELLNQPRKNFLRGPKSFGIGISKGVFSLLSNILGGTTDSLSKITGTLLQTTKMLEGEDEQRGIYEKKEEDPKGIVQGTYSGLKKGINEIAYGVSGILTKPIEGTINEGFGGFFKGIGKGVLGAVLSPVNGILTIGSNLTKGISNSTILNYKVHFVRFREPRILSDNLPIEEYEKMNIRNEDIFISTGSGKNLEISIQNMYLCLENSKKIIEKMYVNKGKLYVIISDILIIFLKDFKDIIDKIYLNDIKDISIDYLNGKNLIKIKIFNDADKIIEINEKSNAEKIINCIKEIKQI